MLAKNRPNECETASKKRFNDGNKLLKIKRFSETLLSINILILTNLYLHIVQIRNLKIKLK